MKTHWQEKNLGEVCDILNGGTPDTKNLSCWGNDHFWITPKDMGLLTNRYTDKTSRKITDVGLKNSSAKILPLNSIILSSRAPIGHLAINTVPMATNQGCKGLIPKEGLNYKILFFFLLNSIDLLERLGSGTTFKELSTAKLKNIKIPVPPLTEQKRLVKKLDAIFTQIAQAKAAAEKNLRNAKELFAGYLQQIFANPRENWQEKNLGEVCDIRPSKQEVSHEVKKNPLVSFVPMADLGILNKKIYWSKEKRLQTVFKDYTYFADGDVLLAKITPCFENGKLGIAQGLSNGIGFGSSEYFVFRSKEKLSAEYLFYALSRESFRKKGKQNMSGAVGHQRVSKEFIESFKIPIPPLAEQKRLVKKLDTLSTKTKKLEDNYLSILENLAELKKSILQLAFNGALT